jgi:hypothetical protein
MDSDRPGRRLTLHAPHNRRARDRLDNEDYEANDSWQWFLFFWTSGTVGFAMLLVTFIEHGFAGLRP